MEVSVARRQSVFSRINEPSVNNIVCRYWLEGRCNRNPCRFLHRESPSPQTERRSPLEPLNDSHRKQPKNLTWRNPNNHISKKDPISSNGGPPKSLSNIGKSGHIDQEMSTAINSKPEKLDIQSEPKKINTNEGGGVPEQCKYWVTENCVQGDKCKNLHSWFCGSGFTMLKKLEGHSKAVTGISLPSDCNKLYSGDKDGTIRVWDCNSGQCAASVTIEGGVGSLVSKGPWLLAGIQNGVKAWNLQNQTEYSLNGPGGLVRTMVTDDDMLFAGMEVTQCHLYGVSSLHPSSVLRLSFSPSLLFPIERIHYFIQDGSIFVWKSSPDTKILNPAAMLKGHTGAVCSLVIGAGRLYSGSKDTTIKVWDLQNLQCLQTLNGHTKGVTSVLCWDRYLLSASLDKSLKVWAATESGAIEMVYEIKNDHGVIALCGIHDAEAMPILLCSFGDNTVRLYDLPSFTERGRIFSKREVQVIQIGIGGLFFTGDATGEVTVCKLS